MSNLTFCLKHPSGSLHRKAASGQAPNGTGEGGSVRSYPKGVSNQDQGYGKEARILKFRWSQCLPRKGIFLSKAEMSIFFSESYHG
jgi:hypothetical protein